MSIKTRARNLRVEDVANASEKTPDEVLSAIEAEAADDTPEFSADRLDQRIAISEVAAKTKRFRERHGLL